MQTSPLDPHGTFRTWLKACTTDAIREAQWSAETRLHTDYLAYTRAATPGIVPLDAADFGQLLHDTTARHRQMRIANSNGVATCWDRRLLPARAA
jgi:hypothetical protein